MIVKIEISYNTTTDSTKLKLPDGLKELTHITQLDVLRDSIELLTESYNKKLEKWKD
jgi:hypothetical protein